MTESIEVGANGDDATRMPPAGSRRREVLVASAAILFGAVAYALATAIEVTRGLDLAIGPRWWPETLAAMIALAGVLMLVQALRGRTPAQDQEPTTRTGALSLMVVAVLVVGFVIAWQYIHFLIVSTVLLIALPAVFGARGFKALVVFPVATVAVLYTIFAVILKVPL